MTPLRIAVVADLLEEGWPSMDLVADMLVDHLRHEHAAAVEATLIRPRMKAHASALPGLRAKPAAQTIDRFMNRLWDYPRALRTRSHEFDVFHIVDHSYAQLVHELPGDRTLVTCHDLDTFRSVLDPERDPRSPLFRAMTRRILEGLRKAGHVACDTVATREALVAKAAVAAGRTSVVHNGPHPSCSPAAEPAADAEAGRLLGPRAATVDLLHVGSTIPRKRIDVLLHVVAAVRAHHANVRLVRVGGAFTAEQRAIARTLGIAGSIVVLPFLDRATLAAIYRRSALVLLPSEREGFGLPMLEALACGTPVIASAIDALREVGGAAVTYCPPEDLDAWRGEVALALRERTECPDAWRRRRDAGLARASAFSWSRYTSAIVALYQQLGHRAPATAAAFR